MADEQQQESANDAQGNSDVLAGLNLSEAELNALKANENLLGLVTHLTEQKRNANAEAKKHREMIEKVEGEKKAQQEEQLKQQGEYQKLYEEAQQTLTQKDEMIKKSLITGELNRLAGMHGLAKAEYLKLLDVQGLEVDLDSLTVKGAEALFKAFKEENPNLFTGNSVANTDKSQPKTTEVKSDKLAFYNQIKARKNKNTSDLAKIWELEKELKKDGVL